MQSFGSKNWRASLWIYAPVFLWIGVIFLFSSPQGSMAETSRIIGPLLNFFFPEMPEATRQVIHAYVRKTAHFTEYAVLSFLAARAFTATLSLVRWRYVLPIVLVVAVASLDEYNQSFEASRTGSVWDILLDISGGAAMVLFLWMINSRREKA